MTSVARPDDNRAWTSGGAADGGTVTPGRPAGTARHAAADTEPETPVPAGAQTGDDAPTTRVKRPLVVATPWANRLTTALPPTPAPAPPGRDRSRHPLLADLGVAALFALLAAALTAGLWPDPERRALSLNAPGQVVSEWFLAYTARVYAGDFAFVTDRLGSPDGVNLLSNPALLLLGILLGPVTLAFGAPVTFAVVTALNLAGTATGWYLLLTRTLHLHRAAALIGGALCGFGPAMMSQANGHPHLTAQWLAPPVVWCVVRLARATSQRQIVLTGLLLGTLVSVQYYLGAEVLFLIALGVAVFCAAYAAADRTRATVGWRPLAAGATVGALIAGLLLAYPLWIQLLGPRSAHGSGLGDYYKTDLGSLAAISPLSLAGDDSAADLATSATEYNTYFGLPLLFAVGGVVLWLWRRPLIVACAGAAGALLLLSLGREVTAWGVDTGIPGPYALMERFPVVESGMPARFALAVLPLFATIVAIGVDAALDRPGRIRLVAPAAVVLALLPIAPLPLPTEARTPAPRYFSEGYWRSCAPPGGVLVPVPPPQPFRPDTMRWAAAAGAAFAVPEGSFIAPDREPRPTTRLLVSVADNGRAPVVSDEQRAAARADVAYWGASCFVLADHPNAEALRATMEQLFGPPQRVVDVWVWQVS